MALIDWRSETRIAKRLGVFMALGLFAILVGAALWQAPGAPQGLPLPAMLRMALIAPSVFGLGGVLRALRA